MDEPQVQTEPGPYPPEETPVSWLRVRWWLLKHDARYKWPERLQRAVANALPRKVAYWAVIRVSGHACTGQWSNERPDTMPVIDVLKRWDIPHERPAEDDGPWVTAW